MKARLVFYFIGITFLLTQYNNCSKGQLESASLSSIDESMQETRSEQVPQEDNNSNSDEKDLGDSTYPNESATLLYYQDFEENTDGIDLASGAKVVTVNSFSGTKSLRGNFMREKTDPITEKKGSATLTNMNSVDLSQNTPNEVYLRFRFRFDDAHWKGDINNNVENNIEVDLKAGYLDTKITGLTSTQASFYPVFRGGENGTVNIGDNLGGRTSGEQETWAGWEENDWAWRSSSNSPTGVLYGRTGQPFGADGQWHLFEMHIEYNVSEEYHYARMFVDGHVVTSSKNAPIERGGRFTLPKQFHLDRFSLFYTGHGNTNLSTNRTGYACGVQVDDIEIWNRFPDKYNP